ncbi:3-carboxyethylcatechol 2,3-dioxygenase [Williamsia sp.]|uniref:3-carboxyethylcatechol 2,3-dioxygenase n=1 Tax=Williamsia sp. TaxID=1872085 RepID=UPI002F94DC78
MPLALCCVSHSPLLELPGTPPGLVDEVEAALEEAAAFVRDWDPELVVIFSPDHYNGFFYRVMPPFCIGNAARGVGDYGTSAEPLDVPRDLADACARSVLEAGVDVAVSESMDVDHGTVQPLQRLLGDVRARPVIPIFVNSVAAPLGPLRRVRALGTAVGRHLTGLDKRVLIVGSGGLSHDPPVPTLATASGSVRERLVHGGSQTPEQRASRQSAVIEAAQDFAAGRGPLRPLNPDWDREFLEIIDSGRLDQFDGWSNTRITSEAGSSAHEVRTWVAAFAAMSTQGPYETPVRYYRAAPELIAGFAIRSAQLTVPDGRA